MVEDYSEKNISHELLHEMMKCTKMMFNSHQGGGRHGFGHHHGMGHHRCGHGEEFGNEFGGFGKMMGGKMRGHMIEHIKEHCHGAGMMQKVGQGRLLILLLENDGISQKALAELMKIAPASVSELINKLEKGACLEKRQNPDDKRVTNIYLTEGGKFLAQKVKEQHDNFSENTFSGLSEEEQKQLLSLLQKLSKSLCERDDSGIFSGNEILAETDEESEEE